MSPLTPITFKPSPLLLSNTYEHGFHSPTNRYAYITKPGLSAHVVKEISHHKSEPPWMSRARLQAYAIFARQPTPTWGGDLSQIKYDAIRYYLQPTENESQDWAEVPMYTT